VRAAGAPPILVIGATLDTHTPYEWAVALAAQLTSGVLLTRAGDGHVSYGKSPCVVEIVTDYLLLAPPPASAICLTPPVDWAPAVATS
jgi:hypothetical protein